MNDEYKAWLLIEAETGAMKVTLETPSRDDKISHRVIPLFIDDERTYKWLGVISKESDWKKRKENAQ